MPRAKRGFKRRRRHNKILDRAEGFVLGRKNKLKRTAEAVDRAMIYAFRDRRVKKREFRQLWIARLSAASNDNGISYSRLVAALRKAQVALDRKILSDIAIADPKAFSAIVDQVRTLAPANSAPALLMRDKLDAIGTQALKDLETAQTLEILEQLRITVLGKKGALSEVLKGLGAVPPAERPAMGAAANEWKGKIEALLQARGATLENAALEERLHRERIDTTLPARLPYRGTLHVVTQTSRRIQQILGRLGFDVTTGPEAETEFLNFDAVNMPADHPARDMQDTFFLGPGVVLRTHTSSVQMRAMRERKWPIRVVCPGAVYRSDSDATHSPMFHQVEGLWIDRGVRMSDLKGVLGFFARELFGADVKIRLRPSYFPFVEPGAEVDVSCFQCRGKPSQTCKICRGSGWLEILGAGMVHPRLLELAGYTDEGLTGFAFGVGIDRIAMLLHEVPDLRLMFQGDTRFLTQF